MNMLEQQWDRLQEITALVRPEYRGHQDQVRLFVEDVRAAIQGEFGNLPPWEADELEVADQYAQRGWLLASLGCVRKALSVCELDDDEYWGGYTYSKPHAPRTARRTRP